MALAHEGMEVTLLEAKRFPRDKVCGEFISPLAVRCLREAGLLDALMAVGARRVDRARLTLPSGVSHEAAFHGGEASPVAVSGAMPSGDESGGWGVTLSRRELDWACLIAAEASGATIRQSVRVTRMERLETDQRSGWRIDALGPTGERESYPCDLLVGADGVGSVVARRLGWLKRAWPERMGITGDFRGWPIEDRLIEMHLQPGAYCGVVGQAEGVTHVGLAFDYRKGDWPHGSTPTDLLRRHLDAFPGVKDRFAAAELLGRVMAFGPMSVRTIRKADDAVLLVGDAAGFLDPITGHGIGFALRSAQLAAETIRQAALQGDFSARSLKSYPAAYRAELGSTSQFFGWMQRALALPFPALQALGRGLERSPGASEWLIRKSVSTGDPS